MTEMLESLSVMNSQIQGLFGSTVNISAGRIAKMVCSLFYLMAIPQLQKLQKLNL
jgi:hypothetical protein